MLILIAPILIATAQVSHRTVPVHPKPVVKAPAKAPAKEPVKLALSSDPAKLAAKTCSLNVSEWDVAKTLQLLSSMSKVNMVLLSNPASKLTIHLEDVPIDEAVRHICALTGLASLRIGGTYIFATEAQLKVGYPAEWEALHPSPPVQPPLAQPQRVVEVYRTSHVNADSLANTLKELFAKEDLTASPGPEVGNPWLNSTNASETIGINSNGSSGTSSTEDVKTQYGEGVKRDLYNKSRTVVLAGEASVVAKALEMAKQLDSPRRQVVIDVAVLETSDELVRELGLSWAFGDFHVFETAPGTGDSRSFNLGNFQRSPLTADAVIKANELKTKSKVLASPSVAVLDGESAFVLIGSRIKYSVLKNPATQFSPATYDIAEDRVGIYLQVAAQIASDGTMTLNLYPQVSTITGYINVNGSNLPQISTREAKTVMRIATGQTVVMGGLIQDSDINLVEKVPILGDIPVLGEFFKRRKRNKVASQLVITITPRIVEVGPK